MGAVRRTGKRRPRELYTRGELNRLIDTLIHPFCKKNKSFVLLDGLLHGVVEANPSQSTLKFLRYNLPALLEQVKAFSDSHKPRNTMGCR